MEDLKIIVFQSGLTLVAILANIAHDVGEPDCQLIRPFVIKYSEESNDYLMTPWLSEYSIQQKVNIHSDKILTIVTPQDPIVKKYRNLTSKY